jgi:hypothetical protein
MRSAYGRGGSPALGGAERGRGRGSRRGGRGSRGPRGSKAGTVPAGGLGATSTFEAMDASSRDGDESMDRIFGFGEEDT